MSPAWWALRDEMIDAGLVSQFNGSAADIDRAVRGTARAAYGIVLAGLYDVDRSATLGAYGRCVLYRRQDGAVGSVVLRAYSAPYTCPYAPLVLRFHVDHFSPAVPGRAVPILGSRGPAGGAGGKLELSVLPDEVVRVARWLPRWIDARDRRCLAPPPPVELEGVGEVRDYRWTARAALSYEAFGRLYEAIVAYRAERRRAA